MSGLKKSSPKRVKRRKYFVSSKIQGRMLSRFALYWVLYHVVLWHAMFLCRYLEYRELLLSGGTPVSFGELYWSFANDHWTLALSAVALSPIIFWDMVKLTHRIAGPLVRIERTLWSLANGQPVSKISLRRGDLPTGVQDALNGYLDAISRRDRCFGRASEAEAAAGDESRVLAELQEIHAMLAGHSSDERIRSHRESPASSELCTEVVVG